VRTVNIHAAKTHLSRLLEDVAGGEEIIIAKAGKPMGRLVPVEKLDRRPAGLLEGQFTVPDDFDTLCAQEIRAMFEDGPIFSDPFRDQE
jgi:prevent-host-death family protein